MHTEADKLMFMLYNNLVLLYSPDWTEVTVRLQPLFDRLQSGDPSFESGFARFFDIVLKSMEPENLAKIK